MKKLLSLALMLVGLSAFGQSHKHNYYTTNANPVWPPIGSSSGIGTNTTIIAPGFSGTALTVKSNMSMGIEGTISWVSSLASVRVDHDIHGADIDLLVMAGGPDVALTPGAYGGSLQFGGIAEIGNHSLWGARAQLNYAGGATAGLPGHSTPLDFEALYGDAPVYSKFSLVGRPGTNIVSDGWANGYLEGWDVPPLWNNTTFSVLPNLQAGRRLFKWGREGLFLDAGGIIGARESSGADLTIYGDNSLTLSSPGTITVSDDSVTYLSGGGGSATLGANDNTFSGTVAITPLGGDNTAIATVDAVGTLARGPTIPDASGVTFTKTVSGIDGTATGDTAILTVPTGKIFYVVAMHVTLTVDGGTITPLTVSLKSDSGVIIDATGIGVGFDANDYVPLYPVTSSPTAKRAVADDLVEFEVNGASTDPATLRVTVIGYFIDE